MIWNDEAIKILTDLWTEGVSSTQIGKRMRCSKNSVLGKVHRLGLPRRTDTDGQKERCPVKPRRSPQNPMRIFLLPSTHGDRKDSLRVYAGPGEACQWLVDGPQCTELAIPGKPYCACHCARAYIKSAA